MRTAPAWAALRSHKRVAEYAVEMANPFITSVSFNKAAYAVGEVATMTVVYGDPDTKTQQVEAKVTDSQGNVVTAVGTFVVDPLTLTVTDSTGRVWTKQSDSGTTAVFKATI